ncbi:transmembrane 9 super member 2 [Rhizophlyctis rosea]|uniref:Transmembrane 9 superfamily member n=1 Tax=Rhizophlyctis rosea TaxID=64517 RepID=A0AAD5X4X2_9FUNG|nr:transmembrane 9 super member 2 [Rhizophlyctis rosea]
MLTGMVGMILLRALHKDISRYNQFGDEDGSQEDFGWKLVHADVFRPPNHRMLLSVLLGNGAQLLMMAAVTLVFAVLGFLSPSSRGSLSTVMIMFYLLFAGLAGYVSARVYKMLQGEFWKRNMFMTATLIPGILFLIFIILNFFLIGAHSSAAVPFGSIVALLALWLVLSLPASLFGGYLGFRAPAFENPVKTNQIPRQIPPQPPYLNKLTSAFLGGLLPFGAIFIELFFILNSIWTHQVYYVFGFLMLVFIILVITCSQVAILLCYFHLCAEDYNWSWRSFLTSATSGLYVFVYSAVYYAKDLTIDNVPSAILYFGWSLVISLLFSILTGTVGYFSTLIFVRKIFASIKVD